MISASRVYNVACSLRMMLEYYRVEVLGGDKKTDSVISKMESLLSNLSDLRKTEAKQYQMSMFSF
jgi:hypothetical protein